MPTLLESGDIRLVPDFLPHSAALFEHLRTALPWEDRIRARRAVSFGLPYNYSGITWPESPWPEVLVPIRERLRAFLGYEPNNCLAHYYPDGNSTMGYHADSSLELADETCIAVVSLGAERPISFRSEADRGCVESYPLRCGSLLIMSAAMQAGWKHAIRATEATTGGRISLTFRRMKDGA